MGSNQLIASKSRSGWSLMNCTFGSNAKLATIFSCLLIAIARAEDAKPLQFSLTLDSSLQSTPYSGRVYVVAAKDKSREPKRNINNWFDPTQVFAIDVKDVKPGESISLVGDALSYPKKLSELEAGEYYVQAVARRSLDHPVPGSGPGDLYSESQVMQLDPATSGEIRFVLNKVVNEREFKETERVKLFEMVSPSLSKFLGRERKIRAGVVLPAGWSENESKKYPVLYIVGGFGGSHFDALRIGARSGGEGTGEDVLKIVPDPTCYRGHSVFADSENNGPWGKALMEELIPAVEAKYRGAQSGKHRYVTGVSSGGWTALWLQVTYPEQFNGCWAHCPDPVDFHDFQQIDLYKSGSNMFIDEKNERRPLARTGEKVMIHYDDFVHMEDVLGPGGQIHSFEAVFSRRLADGQPELMFDRRTGAINTDVAKSWEKYDIRLILERNWSTLGPQLAGKLHVYGGEFDTFYLEGAVKLLQESLTKLGSDAEVKIIPGMAHGLYRDATAQMYQTIQKNWLPSE